MHNAGRQGFPTREDGAVTVEFVIIFPILVLMLMLIVAVSLYIATASEVQQVAHELARESLRVVNGPGGDICTVLAGRLADFVQGTAFLNVDRFAPLGACPGQPDANGMVTIAVTYDLVGSGLQGLGEYVGFNFGQIVRQSSIQL